MLILSCDPGGKPGYALLDCYDAIAIEGLRLIRTGA
jgi:hypothetical protein